MKGDASPVPRASTADPARVFAPPVPRARTADPAGENASPVPRASSNRIQAGALASIAPRARGARGAIQARSLARNV
eukprot:scaffold25332_cov67-Phaeocystis_antarctica.AAC.3